MVEHRWLCRIEQFSETGGFLAQMRKKFGANQRGTRGCGTNGCGNNSVWYRYSSLQCSDQREALDTIGVCQLVISSPGQTKPPLP